MTTLRVILGDQLSESLASLQDLNTEHDWVLMAEVRTEATYVKHNKKKIVLLFSAMRHFARRLIERGVNLKYVYYDSPENKGSLAEEVQSMCQQHTFEKIVLTFPGEYRVLEDMQNWQTLTGVPVEIRDDSRFLSQPAEFAQWADGRKQLRMEFFYREMRKKHRVLMDGDAPAGGKWNYDSANRKPIPKNVEVPQPYHSNPDAITQEVLSLVDAHFRDHCGTTEDFHFAVTREQAFEVLARFTEQRLVLFGDYQDAMKQGSPWLFHSHISFYLNCGLLLPTDVIDAALTRYYEGDVPLNAAEGFVRQVLGWREYVRGLYWLLMPDYKSKNHLNAQRRLPDFFWNGETDMNCMRQCISETMDNAYAHHIQRLMVIGNFSLLAGLSPDDVNDWYLAVYADAYEWVELPNVTGMILFADGGVLASKPYAASGAYIHKMSDYCQNCHYSVKEKLGPTACPFNYLYWHFLDRHKETLGNNPRLGMPYRTLAKMTDEKRDAIRRDSLIFLTRLDDKQSV